MTNIKRAGRTQRPVEIRRAFSATIARLGQRLTAIAVMSIHVTRRRRGRRARRRIAAKWRIRNKKGGASSDAPALGVAVISDQAARPWRSSLPGVAPVQLPSAKVSTPLTMIER